MKYEPTYYIEKTNNHPIVYSNIAEVQIDDSTLMLLDITSNYKVTYRVYYTLFSNTGISGWYLDIDTNKITIFFLTKHYISRIKSRYLYNCKHDLEDKVYLARTLAKRITNTTKISDDTLYDTDTKLQHCVKIVRRGEHDRITFITVFKVNKY